MSNIDTLYFASVDAKRDAAKRLFSDYQAVFSQDPYITQQLSVISAKNLDLLAQMADMELPSLCTQCASTEKGGCCSGYMANETDGILLLINLLMGNSIAKQNQEGDDEECCFLGPKGCILLPKPFFCLNYNCKAITDMEPQKITALLHTAGALLRSQTELETHILEIIDQ